MLHHREALPRCLRRKGLARGQYRHRRTDAFALRRLTAPNVFDIPVLGTEVGEPCVTLGRRPAGPLTPDVDERRSYGRGDRVGVSADEYVSVRFEQGPDVLSVSSDRVLDVLPRLSCYS